MSWSRNGREARRQKVLDALIALAPDERQQFLEQAVAAGDVRSGEVDHALRLVARLDAVRIMTIPPVDGVLHRADVGAQTGLIALPEAPADRPLGAVPTVSPRPAGAEWSPAWLAAFPLPLDAVESAARLIARSKGPRRSSLTQVRTPGPCYLVESSLEEQTPDISWLRP
jgi:hypothetical protein